MRAAEDRLRDAGMLTGIQDAVLIYNPRAGRGGEKRRHALEKALQILRDAGIEAELQATAGPRAATELARKAIAERRQLVIVSGGDGTINEVVNGLAGSQLPMAVLPAGTANVLGKELRLPWDIPAAARLIPQCTLRRIALGVAIPAEGPAAQRYFICMAGAGPDGVLVYGTSLTVKARLGILAYWLEGARQVFAYRFPPFRVVSEGREYQATGVVVGRTKSYGGPSNVTTEADLFEDRFEVLASTTGKWLRNMQTLAAVLLERHRGLEHLHFWKTQRVRLEPVEGHRVHAQVDGEYIGTLPVEFRIVPDALTLAVPPEIVNRPEGVGASP
jgi:YegS/Rv2252/BmrU family lipid kinase